MKREFGKWFLDLAKYILTAIILTTYLTGLEETNLFWVTSACFVLCLLSGYLLLKQSDKEKVQAPAPKRKQVPTEMPVDEPETHSKKVSSRKPKRK